MSSNYDVLCLAHEPPIGAVDGHNSNVEHAIEVARLMHPRCRLAVIEYSGGPVAIGCPPHSNHPHDVRWMDMYWARLVVAVISAPYDGRMEALLDQLRGRHCWDVSQLRRIVRAVDGE